MKTPKLLQVFNSLTKQEKEQFKKYLTVEFSPTPKHSIVLYNYLNSCGNGFNLEQAWQATNTAKPYNNNSLRKIMFDLCELLEQFISISEYIKNGLKQGSSVSTALKNRQLNKLAYSTLTQQKTNNELDAYQNAQELFLLQATNREKGNNLQEVINYLEEFYVVEKLKWILTSYSQKKITQTQVTIYNESETIKRAQLFTLNIKIQGYYNAIKTITEANAEPYYQTLEQLLAHHTHQLPIIHGKNLYTQAINYCIKQINAGNKIYEKKAFELYKKGLENAILLDHNTLSHFTYKNIITLALKLKEFNWAFKAINTYKNFLSPLFINSYFNFCLTLYYFEIKEYKRALKILTSVEYEDALLSLNAKSIQLKAYYEQAAFDTLEYFLKSFKSYVKRKKLSDAIKANFLNLILLTEKLLLCNQKEDFEALQNTISQTTPLSSKEWLLNVVGRYC